MKVLDLVRLIMGNLSRRKARVGLTAIGVVIGTAAVVILVSLAIGLQRNANEQLYGIGDLTQIQVMPAYGMEGGPVMSYRTFRQGRGWAVLIEVQEGDTVIPESQVGVVASTRYNSLRNEASASFYQTYRPGGTVHFAIRTSGAPADLDPFHDVGRDAAQAAPRPVRSMLRHVGRREGSEMSPGR